MRGIPTDSDAIRRLRKERGWTQDELAHQAGISARTLRNAEQGAGVDSVTLALLAEAFGAPLAELMLAVDDPPGGEGQNLALTREWLDAFMAHDLERIMPLHHPRTSVELPGAAEQLGTDLFEGFRRVREHLAFVFETFEMLELKDESLHGVKDRVFHRSTLVGRRRTTGYVAPERYFQEFQFRDGLLYYRLCISDLKHHRIALRPEG